MLARSLVLVIVSLGLAAPIQAQDKPIQGPWNVEVLKTAPKITWVDKDGPLRKLYYESEPVAGKPTRVFAYCAFPEKAEGKSPAMVLVHGGGGKAFPEWASLWAKRGYVAIAMDLAGNGPDGKRLPDGGPGQGDDTKFPKEKTDLKSMWSYHAVAAVIRANSLLRSLPEVDADRIGLTGISWGGYLTCIVAGLDDRFQCAVPVYGCGFLHDNSVWLPTFAKLPEEWRKEWVANFDPSVYVGQAKMPVLFVNGTNDFAYPLDSYQKTYRKVEKRSLCVIVNLPHGHPPGWAPVEIGIFADQHLKKRKPLVKLPKGAGRLVMDTGRIVFEQEGAKEWGPLKVQLHWTTDTGLPWQKRKWQSADAEHLSGSALEMYKARVPKDRPIVYFMTVMDERKATVSTEHVELTKE